MQSTRPIPPGREPSFPMRHALGACFRKGTSRGARGAGQARSDDDGLLSVIRGGATKHGQADRTPQQAHYGNRLLARLGAWTIAFAVLVATAACDQGPAGGAFDAGIDAAAPPDMTAVAPPDMAALDGSLQTTACGAAACILGKEFCYTVVSFLDGGTETDTCHSVPMDCMGTPICDCLVNDLPCAGAHSCQIERGLLVSYKCEIH